MRFINAAQCCTFLATVHYASSAAAAVPAQRPADCHFLPGDNRWPNAGDWQRLNQSVDGRLIAGVPLAQTCHGKQYNEEACSIVQANWTSPPLYFQDPVNVMSPYWLNDTCSPYTGKDTPCTLGNIASFAINVSRWEDAAAGIKFAKKHNIRLTIKNTGHDFLGRSTGRGALALWTHNLKSISVLQNYSSSAYKGPAVRLGAGVQAYEAYPAARQSGLRVMGGFCPTVGIVGGYVQGGGHGPLIGQYGLAADSTLEFEVVTAEGKHLVATPTQNADLYWALNGGGGGTYAVVIAQTTRGHKDGPVAGASLSFSNTHSDNHWAALEAWQKTLLDLDGVVGFNTFWGFTNDSFVLYSATQPDVDEPTIRGHLQPFINTLENLAVPYTWETTLKSSFYEHVAAYTPELPYGVYTTNSVLGGRLVGRETVRANLTRLMATFRDITEGYPAAQFRVNGIASNVTHARVGNTAAANAVQPAWRDALYWLNMDVYSAPRDPVFPGYTTLQAHMNANEAALKVLTPGGGAYMNEATFDNPTWKEDYYGPNYARLLAVKRKHDPANVFYGPASVGSDLKTVAADGRLCKAVGGKP